MAIDWGKLLDDALGDFTIAALPPTLSLPALPVAVTQFIQRSNDPKAEIKDLARIIETDSGLTIELLKHVNSAFVGARCKISSPSQALSVLGLSPSRNLLITVGTRAAIQARQSRLINQACFWNAALQKAIFAREIAKMMKADHELAFNGALLQDYLLPVVTNELYDHYVEFIKARDQHPIDMCEFEQKILEWDHAIAGACLARRWKLPDELVGCILFHHAGIEILNSPEIGRTAAAAVALSALLPDQLRQCYQGLEQLVVVEQAWPSLNLKAVAETVDSQHAATGMGVQNDFPLARRCRSIFTQPALASAGA